MGIRGEWVANCPPERVARIAAASVYVLEVGPPRPNRMQTQEELVRQGLVGLYRVGRKDPERIARDQKSYLEESQFVPSPGVLKNFAALAKAEDEP